ncbi:MAG: dTDP-4-dehydrorhamnose 3,5-epimerase family protein, partial [Alphaproteobacteria bacterium]
MIFTETNLAGVMIIDIERLTDDRGFFARGFCAEEFAGHGLAADFVQTNIAHNAGRGTLRGMHYQA